MVLGIWRILATIIFLYLLWRNLKDDYRDTDLAAYGWGLLLWFLIGGRITYGLVHWGVWNDYWLDWLAVWAKGGFDYYGGYAAAIGYSLIVVNRNSWKIWKFAENITKWFMVFIIMLLVGELMAGETAIEAFTRLVVLISTLAVVIMVEGKYRSYTWYRSGRSGFVFFWANGWYALVSLVISIWLKEVVILRILYLSWGLISLVGLFILGEVLVPLKVKLKKS